MKMMTNRYTKAIKVLENYFQPAVSIAAERYRFGQRSQIPGESTDADESIRDQLIEKMPNNKICDK